MRQLETKNVYDRAPIFDFDSPEAIKSWNGLAQLLAEHGLGFYVNADGARVERPISDEAGRVLCRLIIVPREEKPKPKPHERTLGDVMTLDPDDAFDAVMAPLPMYASFLDRAKAALLANIPGPVITARLRCSASLLSRARRELREELPENEWPMSLSNSKAHSRQSNLSRPNMCREAGGNPLQLRARNLGISEAEARAIANGKNHERKFLERPEDVARRNDNRDAARKRRTGE